MGLDDGCNTGLDLGLGFTATPINQNPSKPIPKRPQPPSSEPTLTLSLSGDFYHGVATKKSGFIDVNKGLEEAAAASPPHSVASSFSSGRIKRERDLSCEEVEVEVERVSSRVSDEDEDAVNARKKLRLTKDQSALLEESFKQHSTLNPKQKQALARQLNLRPRQVEVWFQNRRARTKLKQTEVDCEFLKKCCESLTDENRRLQKELSDLKALKLAQPFYMQLPAATLTMCPSCERIGGVGDGASNKPPYSMGAKPTHCYNPFANSAATC
ncbi:homeobox-leucine zipper protein HAT22-like [Mangifera indica]|uniref:homeobox-leucine zipper protein HAT22-like n=1 Tax=Mangifera indica TaxID=29780 RepID=UPI001CFB467D|nr:homeobox-leucine zipper protein HAT22-like [Mangifera indica]